MDQYTLNVSIRKSGGGSGKNTMRGSINLPKAVLNDMGITLEDKEVILYYDNIEKEIIIKKSDLNK